MVEIASGKYSMVWMQIPRLNGTGRLTAFRLRTIPYQAVRDDRYCEETWKRGRAAIQNQFMKQI